MSARYFDLIREMKQNTYNHRLRLLQSAQERGIKPTNRYGVSFRDLVWQTDNGGEFKGSFPTALGDSQHVRIPPAAHNLPSSPLQLCLLRPVFLDYYLNESGGTKCLGIPPPFTSGIRKFHRIPATELVRMKVSDSHRAFRYHCIPHSEHNIH